MLKGQPLYKCVDSHQLLVNLRAVLCCDSLGKIKRGAFETVAKQGNTKLNNAIVKGMDKHSNGFALTMFSCQVEEKLLDLRQHSAM